MSSVFISYRREDTAGHAGRLYDRLVQRLGEDTVFMDLEIEPGDDFVERIEQGVGSCEVLLVLVGRQWLTVEDAAGNRRLDDPADFVRIELAVALSRNVRVIPVLVGGAKMPTPGELPEDLVKFSRRQALDLSDVRFNADFDRLVSTIEREVAEAQNAREIPAGPRPSPPAVAEREMGVRNGGKQRRLPKEIAEADAGLSILRRIAGACGVGLIAATLMVPAEEEGVVLVYRGYYAFEVPILLVGIALVAAGFVRAPVLSQPAGLLSSFVLCLTGSVIAFSVTIYFMWLRSAHAGIFLWAALGGVALVAGSLGVARLWAGQPAEMWDLPMLVATLAGGLLLVPLVYPLAKYGQTLFGLGDNTWLDAFVALVLGVPILVAGLRPRRSFRSRQPRPWLIGPALLAGAFALIAASDFFTADDNERVVGYWLVVSGLMLAAAGMWIVQAFRQLPAGKEA